jgi:tetratricopeptide (TPR) repeat protein
MNHQASRPLKNSFWLVVVLLGLSLIHCSYLNPAQPLEISLEQRIGQLQASHTQLVAGEKTDVRVGVIRSLDEPDPYQYQWGTTGGFIVFGQNTCCITYQAPDIAGAYQVSLVVKYNNQFVQRSISLQVIAPTPTPEPTPTLAPSPTPPLDTSASPEAPLSTAQEYFERAQTNYLQRNYERTIADYSKAIELNYEPLSQPYYNRGYVYYTQQKYSQAIEDFSKAIELNYDPLNLVYYNRGNTYYYKGDNDHAIADYTKAIELKFEPLSWLYNSRGLALRKKGEYEQAIADYTKAIELKHEPLNWPYYNRANAYADQANYPEAVADYSQAIQIDPSSIDAYYGRGQAYKKMGDVNKAIADFQKVVELGNDFWRQEAQTQLQELGVTLPESPESGQE